MRMIENSLEMIQSEVALIAQSRDSNPADEDHFRRLFNVFVRIENALGALSAEADEEARERQADSLLRTQTVIMRLAASMKATNLSEALFKLALWRWDAEGLDLPHESMKRSDAVAYSAFRDLAELSGVDCVLTSADRTPEAGADRGVLTPLR